MKSKKPDIPLAVERTVRAMCEDYDRRAAEIARGKLSPEVIGHYMILNALIDRAIAKHCEEGVRHHMRLDIANGIGYRGTQLYFLGATTYKDRKRKTKLAIAKALHLL